MAITTNGGAGVTADAVATLSNKTLEQPVINNATFTGAQAGLEIKFGNSIVLEGATDDAFEVTLSGGDPTSDRVITLPDLTGTVVLRDTVETLTNKTLTSPVVSGLTLSDASVVFEGATADAFETTLTVTDPTADRTVTFQDASGTVVLRDSTDTLTNKTLTSPVVSGLTLSDASIVLEGTTANDFETTLTVTDPTADRTITFPDSTGTVALTSGVINNTLTTTTGDMIYASSANTPARLGIGTAGQTLVVSAGGIPEWGTAASGGVSANDQAFAFAVQVFA
jgi:hypothetical protein